ncbi:G protein-coupled glucose receptor regulating Gpa2-domain-containing protein [Calycina marina]|uniref:G protein-coupled glucose receptor regulating Gpa2-domain-containing protein n=1 Tax=Calycina marina TaxID=1763456 RepID=A0A9P7Z7I6_9HELO|nr:G protein-coupled glucose receptor regulating Gpa2-domain-containing protein [Calycina marina]
MAPLAIISQAISETIIARRSLGPSKDEERKILTGSQQHTLQCLALAFSTFSVASAILAFYWFIKMRRSFRHDLVMLLIQSDMFKALWLMIYPIITFAHGPIASSSKACQANGFFLAVGIEASDVAVLMIAIHSAMYIFNPRGSKGEGGLYPYRNFAYAIWIIYPLTMASLAFINKGNSYVNDGTYCYLPIRPFWYRLALAWIPRYLIFVFILGVYSSIYFYVRAKFRGFTDVAAKDNSNDSTDSAQQAQIGPLRGSAPQTPPLALNGLIPELEQSPVAQDSTGVEGIMGSPLSTASGAHRFIWSNLISINPSSPTTDDQIIQETIIDDEDPYMTSSTTVLSSPMSLTLPTTPPSVFSSAANTMSRTRAVQWNEHAHRPVLTPGSVSPGTVHSVVDIFTVLENRPGDTAAVTPLSQLRLVNSRGQNLAIAEMLGTRDKIRRQLRFLFIYPLVYIGMWLLPFVFHVLQYQDKFTQEPPFALLCLTTICVASQAAVDCWLFSTREKPWRHIPGNNKSFFGSLRFWSGWKGFTKRRVVAGPGKTQDEMFREAQAAYHRRDEEIAQQRINYVNIGTTGDTRKERSWWEASGLDTIMTPTVEDVNPMDDVHTTNPGPTHDPNALGIRISLPERRSISEILERSDSQWVNKKR